jgi:hypothetical protein
MVQDDQHLRWVRLRVQQRRQQSVNLIRAGSIRVVEGVLDDPNRDAVTVGIPVLGRGVKLGQERAVGQGGGRLEDPIRLDPGQQMGLGVADLGERAEAEEIPYSSRFSGRAADVHVSPAEARLF